MSPSLITPSRTLPYPLTLWVTILLHLLTPGYSSFSPLGGHIYSSFSPSGWPYLLILLTLWVARFTGATEIIGDECAIAELSNGTVVLNARDYVNQSQHTWVHPGGIVMFNCYAYVLL